MASLSLPRTCISPSFRRSFLQPIRFDSIRFDSIRFDSIRLVMVGSSSLGLVGLPVMHVRTVTPKKGKGTQLSRVEQRTKRFGQRKQRRPRRQNNKQANIHENNNRNNQHNTEEHSFDASSEAVLLHCMYHAAVTTFQLPSSIPFDSIPFHSLLSCCNEFLFLSC